MTAPTLELDLISDPALLRGIRHQLREWLVAHRWPEPACSNLVLAADEALTNVIRHGYKNRHDQPIELQAKEVVEPRPGVEIRIRDYGQQVDPASIAGRALDDLRPGGLGVHIIRGLMDEVSYSRAQGGGMCVTMRKYRDDSSCRDDVGVCSP